MKKQRKGFTLYGLLAIVIALAILVAVVWPICSARLDARRAAEAPTARASHVEAATTHPPVP